MQHTHLSALELRLSNKRLRLASAKTKKERELRTVWISQIEQEIRSEIAFSAPAAGTEDMSDDELLSALGI